MEEEEEEEEEGEEEGEGEGDLGPDVFWVSFSHSVQVSGEKVEALLQSAELKAQMRCQDDRLR